MPTDVTPVNSFRRNAASTSDADVMTAMYDFINTDATVWQIKSTTPAGSSTAFTAEATSAGETLEVNIRLSAGTIYVALSPDGGITNPTTLAGPTITPREEIFIQSTTADHTLFHCHEWTDALCMIQCEPITDGIPAHPEGFMSGRIMFPLFASDDTDNMVGYMHMVGQPAPAASGDYWLTTSGTTKTYLLADGSGSGTWIKVEAQSVNGPGTAILGGVTVGTLRRPMVCVVQTQDNRPVGYLKYGFWFYRPEYPASRWKDTTNNIQFVFYHVSTSPLRWMIPTEWDFIPG
jgi:hypothetical protein